MALTTAGAIIGGALIGGVGSALGSRSQARATERAADQTLQASREAQEFLRPYQEGGQQGLDPLIQMALQGPQYDYTADYSRAAEQGRRDIMSGLAAGRKLNSGGTFKALQENRLLFEEARAKDQFNVDRMKYSDQIGALFDLTRMGANAAAGQATNARSTGSDLANLALQKGNAQAAGYAGIANAANSGITNYLLWGGSDIRFKDNVQHIGVYRGRNIYTWDWNETARKHGVDDRPAVGVMAHEVEPEHVAEKDGFLYVNYGTLWGN